MEPKKLTRIELPTTAEQIKKEGAAAVFAGMQTMIRELQDRAEGERQQAIDKMVEDFKLAQKQLGEQDEIIKARLGTPMGGASGDFSHLIPMITAKRIVPEDAQGSVEYYNLCSFTPEELRYAADFDTLKDSPFQRTARSVEDVGDKLLREFHRVNDQLYIADLVLSSNRNSQYARSGNTPHERMKQLNIWKRWEKVLGELQKRALSTGTATSGGNWVPTQLSARLAELIQPMLRVAALFETVDMPNKSFDYPVLGADPVAFLIAEGATIAGLSGALSEVVTNKTTLTAVKLAGRTIASTEVLEDAAIALEAIMMRKLQVSISRAIEEAIINGDTLITAGGTGAQDYDMQAAQLTGFATDRRGAWNGMRKISLNASILNSTTSVSLATFSLGNLLAIRALMKGGTGGNMFGVAASDLAWIVNLAGYIKLLTASESSSIPSALLTVEKYGPGATVLTGEVAQLCGSPVILSEFVRDDVSATGLNTMAGPNTKSTLQLVHRGAYVLGRRRDITVQRSSEHRFDTDEMEYTGTWRGHWRDLYPVASAANRSVGIGINF